MAYCVTQENSYFQWNWPRYKNVKQRQILMPPKTFVLFNWQLVTRTKPVVSRDLKYSAIQRNGQFSKFVNTLFVRNRLLCFSKRPF